MSESDQPAEHRSGPAADGDRPWRGIVWLGLLALFAVWVAIGRVATYRGGGLRNTARVWDVLRALRRDFPLPGPAVIALLLLILSSCAWLLWLGLTIIDHGPAALRPPAWAIGALVPLGFVFVALVLWADPRDDVTGEALMNRTGVERTMMPTACATFLGEAAALRSGDLLAGRAERAAGFACQDAIATTWPTEGPAGPTQAPFWSTVETAGRRDRAP